MLDKILHLFIFIKSQIRNIIKYFWFDIVKSRAGDGRKGDLVPIAFDNHGSKWDKLDPVSIEVCRKFITDRDAAASALIDKAETSADTFLFVANAGAIAAIIGTAKISDKKHHLGLLDYRLVEISLCFYAISIIFLTVVRISRVSR